MASFPGLSQGQPGTVSSPPVQRKDLATPMLLFGEILSHSTSDLSQRRPHHFAEVSLCYRVSIWWRFEGREVHT
jgi:hypothetical protein